MSRVQITCILRMALIVLLISAVSGCDSNLGDKIDKAGEDAKEVGKSIERTSGTIERTAGTIEEASENLIKAADKIDPVGLKKLIDGWQNAEENLRTVEELNRRLQEAISAAKQAVPEIDLEWSVQVAENAKDIVRLRAFVSRTVDPSEDPDRFPLLDADVNCQVDKRKGGNATLSPQAQVTPGKYYITIEATAGANVGDMVEGKIKLMAGGGVNKIEAYALTIQALTFNESPVVKRVVPVYIRAGF